MKVFRELRIRGPHEQIEHLIDDITATMGQGWKRGTEQERDLWRQIARQDMFCFECTDSQQRRASALWLTYAQPNEMYVSNIVPREVSSLSYDEYNSVLLEFHDRFISQAAAGRALTVELGEGDVDLEHWLSPNTANQLRSFSAAASKSTGSSHPSDRERWHRFIVSAHNEAAPLDASTLARWLHEDGGWSESLASDLAIEYEQGRELLDSSEKFAHAGDH